MGYAFGKPDFGWAQLCMGNAVPSPTSGRRKYVRGAFASTFLRRPVVPVERPAYGISIGGPPFDLRGLFTYANQPDELPEIMEWVQTAFRSYNKPQTSPPQPPWERSLPCAPGLLCLTQSCARKWATCPENRLVAMLCSAPLVPNRTS